MKRAFGGLSKRRGFTLTEFAITLGMLALIMGAIWIAYTRAVVNYNATRLSNDVTQILVNYSNTAAFSLSNFPASSSCFSYTCADPVTHQPTVPPTMCYWGGSNSANASLANAKAGLIPVDMLNNPTNPTFVKNFFNGYVNTTYNSSSSECTSGTGTAPTTGHAVSIDVGTIPQAACTQMLLANEDKWLQYGFNQICTNNCAFNVWFGAYEPGLSLANIQTACGLSSSVDLMLDFNFPMIPGT